MEMWKPFQVAYFTPKGVKKIGHITALSIKDAKDTLKQQVKIDNNEWFDCKITRVWEHKPQSNKQKLSQRYGWIMGNIKSVSSCLNYTATYDAPNGIDRTKFERAKGLVDMQISKLQRDVRDFYKLLGLKVK